MTHPKSRTSRVLWFGIWELVIFLKPSGSKNGSSLRISNHVRVLKSLSELEGAFVKKTYPEMVPYVSQRPVSWRYQENYVPRQIVGPRFHFCDHVDI